MQAYVSGFVYSRASLHVGRVKIENDLLDECEGEGEKRNAQGCDAQGEEERAWLVPC